MRCKNNIPLQQHETTNKLPQSSEYNLKTLEVVAMAGLRSAAKGATAELLEAPDSYRTAPARPGSPAVVC